MRIKTSISIVAPIAGLAFMLTGCSESTLRPDSPELAPDRVISRIDNLDSRPDWLKESEPFAFDTDRVVSLGGTEIPADHRIDAAYRIAENNAQASIAGAIEKKLEFIFQNAEEGTGMDETQARFIGAEATRLITSALRPGKHYWEKVAFTTDGGRRLTKYRVFSTVEMPQEDFKRAIFEALRRASGKRTLSADFAEKVNQQWDRFTAPAAAPAPEAVPEPTLKKAN